VARFAGEQVDRGDAKFKELHAKEGGVYEWLI
jgi:hypothetical protein